MRLLPPCRWTRGFDCRCAAGQPIVSGWAAGERDRRSAMAKGQERSNREPKKLKADKKKTPALTGTAPGAKPKPGGAKAETKT
jgi:hypothetical protein